MSDKRFLGNIITSSPTEPAGPYEDGAAKGVWSLEEAFTYIKAGKWPTAGNLAPIGLFGGGGTIENRIDRITIATAGNATDFGDLTSGRQGISACSSSTRGVWGGGTIGGGNAGTTNIIDYVTIASAGNATDFGDLTLRRKRGSACSSSTRGVFGGGNNASGSTVSTIDYITIATTGNATSFGSLYVSREATAACASATRGVWAGGQSPTTNVIQYITIDTTGNSVDFGDLTIGREGLSACSSSTRGLIGGGTGPSNVIEYITIATTGNATDFGDLTMAREGLGACSSTLRGVFAGGIQSTATRNVIDYVNIASTGNATDFGDLTVDTAYIPAGCSNAHGGL